MHVALPFGAAWRRLTGLYSYFRTGVKIEGEAWLCNHDHVALISFGGGQDESKVPQHVDVELRFWNRRAERVSVIEILRAEIPTYSAELTPDDEFKPLTLEPGAAPLESSFELVPKDDPGARVEAALGAWLELEFRPSRGSERWARPRFRCQLGGRGP